MNRNNNQVNLIGFLGQDPEIIEARNGTTIAKLSLATSSSYKDRQGNWQTGTEWHKVTAFGKLAENLTRFIRKGSQLSVSGQLKYNKWTDKHDQPRTTAEVIVSGFTLLDKKEDRRTDQRRANNYGAPTKHTGQIPVG